MSEQVRVRSSGRLIGYMCEKRETFPGQHEGIPINYKVPTCSPRAPLAHVPRVRGEWTLAGTRTHTRDKRVAAASREWPCETSGRASARSAASKCRMKT